MSWLNDIIAVVSPSTALKRARQLSVYNEVREYDAAKKGKRGKQWDARSTSSTQEIRKALRTLRDRSRDLVRNNTYARRAVQAIANNTVGSGIRPSMSGVNPDEERMIMREWHKWADSTACDYDGIHNLNGLQKLVMRAVVESGECVILKRRRGRGTDWPVAIQVVEAEFIDSTKDQTVLENGNGYIVQGVEFDADGRKTALWLYDRHPSDFTTESRRVPMSECAHIYLMERPGQVRGVPWMASAMTRLRDLDAFEDAHLMRQKMAALTVAVVTKNDPNSVLGSTEEGEEHDTMYPGGYDYLAPGESITFNNPNGPQGYDEYVKRVLQGVASGIGLTYEALTGDLGNVNFSSGRMGWLEFQRNVQEWQSQMLVPMMMERLWGWFEQMMEIKGMGITQPDRVIDWTMPRREMIDPVKEVKAMSDMVRNGFISWSESIRMMGGDPDDVATELFEDYAQWDALGLKLQVDPRWDAGKSPEAAAPVDPEAGTDPPAPQE